MSSETVDKEGGKRPQVERSDSQETPDVHALHSPIMREHNEPRDGYEPIPPWIAIFYGLLLFWGGFYLATYSGGFRADVYDENALTFGASTADQKEADPIAQGGRIYTINCAACHQQTGLGVAGKFPPLAGSKWVLGDPRVLVRILLHGLEGPIEVAGDTYNGNMPAFGKKLDDKKLSLVLNYIRQSWGNEAASLTSEEIARIRKTTTSRSDAWTVSDLEQLPPPKEPEKRKTQEASKKEMEIDGDR